jgi:hypothetical protein
MLEDSPERQQAYQPEQREPRWLLELPEQIEESDPQSVRLGELQPIGWRWRSRWFHVSQCSKTSGY